MKNRNVDWEAMDKTIESIGEKLDEIEERLKDIKLEE